MQCQVDGRQSFWYRNTNKCFGIRVVLHRVEIIAEAPVGIVGSEVLRISFIEIITATLFDHQYRSLSKRDNIYLYATKRLDSGSAVRAEPFELKSW
jgi:hypothetical protein